MEELVKSKLEKPKKLLQLAAREWKEIDDNTLIFDRQAAEVSELKQLAKSDLTSFFQVGAVSSALHCFRPKQYCAMLPLARIRGYWSPTSCHNLWLS